MLDQAENAVEEIGGSQPEVCVPPTQHKQTRTDAHEHKQILKPGQPGGGGGYGGHGGWEWGGGDQGGRVSRPRLLARFMRKHSQFKTHHTPTIAKSGLNDVSIWHSIGCRCREVLEGGKVMFFMFA